MTDKPLTALGNLWVAAYNVGAEYANRHRERGWPIPEFASRSVVGGFTEMLKNGEEATDEEIDAVYPRLDAGS